MDEPASVVQGPDEARETAVHELLGRWEAMLAFGPRFFLAHLGAYVRDRCPDPGEALPFVHLHLASSEVLDVCHVIGLTPRWVALAVYEATSRAMRTELVPFESITRITISPGHAQGTHIGFHQETPPALQESAEETLHKAADPGSGARRRPNPEAPPRPGLPMAEETDFEPGGR